jgi:hypothetical protein
MRPSHKRVLALAAIGRDNPGVVAEDRALLASNPSADDDAEASGPGKDPWPFV